jgi:ABC-type multidrug transport system ATPase subunit
MLELCDLYDIRDRPIRELSSGEKAATVLATAIAPQSQMLVIDDLLGNIPLPLRDRIWSHLQSRRVREPFTSLFATTCSELAERADRVAILDKGRLLAYASPGELLATVAPDRIVIEPADPSSVQRTLRGIFDVEITASGGGLRFSTMDGEASASQLLRRPLSTGSPTTVLVKPPTLWDVLEELRSGNMPDGNGQVQTEAASNS